MDCITQIHGKVKSILDFSLTNRPVMVERVLVTSDTKRDHFTLTLTRAKPDQVAPPIVEGRSWKNVDWSHLKSQIKKHHQETLGEICKTRNVDKLVNRFTAWANVLLDDKYPVKRTIFKAKYTPWMTKPVLKLIREKLSLLKKYQRTHLDVHGEAWLKLKMKVGNKCREVEQNY